MSRAPLTEAELRALIGDDDVRPYLNAKNALYRERDFKNHPPSKDEAIRLMAEEPNLIKRPLLAKGPQRVFGFDEAAWREMLG